MLQYFSCGQSAYRNQSVNAFSPIQSIGEWYTSPCGQNKYYNNKHFIRLSLQNLFVKTQMRKQFSTD